MTPRELRPPVVLAALVALTAVGLTLFAWPQARSGPRDLPIGVAGPAPAVSGIERTLAARGGAFDVERYAGEAAARQAIEERRIYGAIVAGARGMRLLTAPAASPAVAQLLEQAVRGAAAGRRGDVSVVELVRSPADDPRGAALTSSLLPLLLVGMATGALVGALARPPARTVALLVLASALVGLAAVAVVQGWLGVLEGGWLMNAGALASIVLAVSATAAGLDALLGPPRGLVLAALVFVLVGNPWSGVSSAPELLPKAAGTIGQLLPPGAAGQVLRGTAFFDGAGTARGLVVLAAWAAIGVGALTVAGRRAARVGATPSGSAGGSARARRSARPEPATPAAPHG